MKRFIDANGTFEIMVPETWKYFLDKGKVHTFQEYEIWKSDAFQLSIREPKNEKELINFKKIIDKLPKTKINGKIFYSYPDFKGNGLSTKMWTSLIKGKIVLFTLTYSTEPDLELDPKTLNEKIELVYQIISEFKLIEDTKSEDKINLYRFDMFLQGFGATSYMLNKAVSNQSFIEATCIFASQIDALLRIGIVLRKQIINNNNVIEKEWIYQGISDKKISEKHIYKKAKELKIINDEIFNDLFRLYDDRNRVIHRFIISEITVAEIEEITYKYYQMQQKINNIVYDIESKQIEMKVGMTKQGGNVGVNYIDYIKGKIGKQNYFEEKK